MFTPTLPIKYTEVNKKKSVIQKYLQEKERGLVHTPEWEEFIRQEQKWLEGYQPSKDLLTPLEISG